MEIYKLRLPNGTTVDRELERDEVEYWLSVGMYLAHGFQLITQCFAAEQMDELSTVPIQESSEPPLAN